MEEAFKTAKLEKPGAAVVILPENFAAQMIEINSLPVTALPENIPEIEAIKAASALIQKHRKPFIIVGNGVIRTDADS